MSRAINLSHPAFAEQVLDLITAELARFFHLPAQASNDIRWNYGKRCADVWREHEPQEYEPVELCDGMN